MCVLTHRAGWQDGLGLRERRRHVAIRVYFFKGTSILAGMPLLLRLSLGLFLTSLVSASEEAEAYLKQYAGRWEGDFTIHSAATGYTQTFPVAQRYWWADDALHGVSVSDREDGMRTARSKTYVAGDRFISEVDRGDAEATYYGVLHDSGIVWLSSDLARATDYQMREVFVEVDGREELHTDGFDSYIYQGGLAQLVFRGRLKQVAEEL